MRVHVGRGAIEVVQGDIADQSTDAIVNAANTHLWMGGGVAGAIKRRGGASIEQEAMGLGPVDIGQSVMTGAGTLHARYVIHAAVMGQDLHTDAAKIKAATSSALRLADEHRLASLSLPALGTGVGGFSPFHCATIMITGTVESLMQARYLELVRFVLFDNETLNAFEAELRLQFSVKRH